MTTRRVPATSRPLAEPAPTRPWKQVVGTSPAVVVYERTLGGTLHARIWDPGINNWRKRSLGHRDRVKAVAWAQERVQELAAVKAAERGTQVTQRADGDGVVTATTAVLQGPPTVRGVMLLYLLHRTPTKKPLQQAEDRRRAQMWTQLYGDRVVPTLGSSEWTAFIRDRRAGVIDPHGHAVPEPDRQRVTERTVDADLVFAIAVFNWAVQWPRPGNAGLMLLERNPWAGAGKGVKRVLARPSSRRVQRAIAPTARYHATMAVAAQVTVWVPVDAAEGCHNARGRARRQRQAPSALPVLLLMAYHTGRRIAALCALTRDRLIWQDGVITHVRFPPLKDEDEVDIPVRSEVGAALALQCQRMAAYGDCVGLTWSPRAPVFPRLQRLLAWRPGDPEPAAIDRWQASKWLRKAEGLAKLEKLPRGLWHPYRRAWNTRRKHQPARDRQFLAGWKDQDTMNLYEHPDAESTAQTLLDDRDI